MKKSLQDKLTIFLVLVVSFFLASYIGSDLFWRFTPKLKYSLDQYFTLKVKQLASLFTKNGNAPKFAQEVFSRTTLENMSKAAVKPLQKVSSGVYAVQEGNVVRYVYKQNEVDWVSYTVTLHGKPFVINVPKGQTVPDKASLEKIY